MKNCAKKIKIVHVVGKLTPKIDESRTLPNHKKSSSHKVNNPKGEKIYKTSCIGCHGSGALGAPKFGDSVAWDKIIKKGMKGVYKNAINGIDDMPARGGNSTLSDDDVKSAVDYMVESSK
jgi:cytochrome c5